MRFRPRLSSFPFPAIALLLLLIIVILQVVVSMRSWPIEGSLNKLLYHPYMLLVWAVLCVLMLETKLLEKNKGRFVALIPCAFLVALFVSPYAPLPLAASYGAGVAEGEEVHAIAHGLPHDAVILADLRTMGALTRFDTAYAYERLPSHLAPPETRKYPLNEALLTGLFEESITHVLMQRSSVPLIEPYAGSAELQEVAGTHEYVLYEVRR
jgi:hypothetical protein